jgi:pyruvate dehydrogenase E1 component alpha subunit
VTASTKASKARATGKGSDLPPGVDNGQLLDMMHWMRLGRAFDHRAISLQRQGKSGTYGPMAGQEAALVGSATALD